MANETILTFAADIVSAHVSNNSVAAHELPALIMSVYDALENLGKPELVIEEKREPVVSIRSSVKPDAITCLECGARQKMLKRHLGTHHQLTPAEYKVRWGLNADYPLVAPDYAATRRDLAVKIGLGRKATIQIKPTARAKPIASPKPVTVKKPKVAKVVTETV